MVSYDYITCRMTQQWTVREARGRKRPPMTQEELADKSGFDQTYISLIERGLRIPTDPDVKARLAKALGIAPSKLRFSEPQPEDSVSDVSDRVGQGVRSTPSGERSAS